ncbi:hypothetical protein BGX21_005566 [Mortierella sp. AD011]|nr:hypothetical protein BGX20_002137 [Mortierella sp. AD010]KAF9399823.1 hypothetical protein BGX21_005566 [Mortierella sp. AD011]
MNPLTGSMQVFEFQADSSVSLVSTAAINRKSCDHCFLNRKTCDKVRQADSGEKCKRCAKDNRPCTFTPTVHLYHIADCVGRHQCRAKVIQAMGGVKKEVQFKTIEIPIVCDMDNDIDRALFEYIQKNPNLLVYNNRIKSFLAQEMLGISPDQDPVSNTPYGQSVLNYIPPPTVNVRGSFSSDQYGSGSNPLTSPMQGPARPYVSHRSHPYLNASPRAHPAQNVVRHGSMNGEVFAGFTNGGIPGTQVSPSASPLSLSPLDSAAALGFDQRRHSNGFVADMTAPVNPYGGAYQQVQPFQQQQQQQQHHPYAAQSPYPQPQFFVNNNSYRRTPSPFSTSPVAPSPIQQYNSQPPSPLELSLNAGTNLGTLSNNSHQNLTSLFDNNMTMGNQSSQSLHRRQPSMSSLSAASSASPAMSNNNQGGDMPTPGSSAPMVITTLNEDGHEVGFYYAVPAVSLNPGASDADLFQDFTVMEDTLGENFVWVENLFDENATGVVAGDASGSNLSSSSAIPIPGAGVTESMMMEGLLAQQRQQQQQHDEWSSQYAPQGSYDNHTLQG